MLGIVRTAVAAAERRRDVRCRWRVLKLHEPDPPLGVVLTRGHVDGLVARDPDVALRHEHHDHGDEREQPTGVLGPNGHRSLAKLTGAPPPRSKAGAVATRPLRRT